MKPLLPMFAKLVAITTLRAQEPFDKLSFYTLQAKENEFVSFDTKYYKLNIFQIFNDRMINRRPLFER